MKPCAQKLSQRRKGWWRIQCTRAHLASPLLQYYGAKGGPPVHGRTMYEQEHYCHMDECVFYVCIRVRKHIRHLSQSNIRKITKKKTPLLRMLLCVCLCGFGQLQQIVFDKIKIFKYTRRRRRRTITTFCTELNLVLMMVYFSLLA